MQQPMKIKMKVESRDDKKIKRESTHLQTKLNRANDGLVLRQVQLEGILTSYYVRRKTAYHHSQIRNSRKSSKRDFLSSLFQNSFIQSRQSISIAVASYPVARLPRLSWAAAWRPAVRPSPSTPAADCAGDANSTQRDLARWEERNERAEITAASWYNLE